MKRIKTSLLKRYNVFLGLLLSLLGFGAACSLNSCEYGTPAVEYGTPYATFKVKGTVKSEVTSSAIPDIRVVMGNDTTFTDESGNYNVSYTEFPKDQSFVVEFDDIDGDVKGAHQPLDTIVEFKDPTFSGGTGGWDRGETEKEVSVKLSAKE